MTLATANSLQPAASHTALDTTIRKQNLKEADLAGALAALKPAKEGAVDIDAIERVPSTSRRGNSCQSAEVLSHKADHYKVENIRLRPVKRTRRLSSDRSTVHESLLAATPAVSVSIAAATVYRLFDNCVFAYLPVGVASLQGAKANVVASNVLPVYVSTSSGFRRVSHERR